MTKLGLTGFSMCLLAAAALGCGAPAPHGDIATAAQADSAEVGGAQAQAQVDPKISEAQLRCAKEIEQAELQPPDQLSKIQIAACMYASTDKAQKCFRDAPKEVVVKVVINKDGTVANAFPIGDSADSPEAGCVADVVKSVTFPKFKGQPQQNIKYPFNVGG